VGRQSRRLTTASARRGLSAPRREEHHRMNAAQRDALAALPEMQANIAADRVISCSASRADPGGECWAWLRDFSGLIDALIRAQRLTGLHILFPYGSQEPRP